MAAVQSICIIGAGMAGGRAAEALRELGFDGRLVLLGQEPERPYERPPLSKAWLLGELPEDKLYLRPPAYLAEQGIEFLAGRTAEAIDPAAGLVTLAGGEQLEYDRLLLATGARPRRLEVPGADLDGVVCYRDLQDARQLTLRLAAQPRVLVVGAGFLGMELAATCRQRGCQVTVVEAGPLPTAALGPLPSRYLQRLHSENGVQIRVRTGVQRFQGGGRLEAAELIGGQLLECDLALVCIGAEPNSAIARVAGLDTDPGIIVDQNCQTRQPGVFAAGDVASWWSARWRRRLRLEHYDNAHRQGRFVAAAMLGDPAPFDSVPYFWTEHYQGMVQQVGITPRDGQEVLRGEPDSNSFSVVHLSQGRVQSCVAVNRFRDLSAARRLISEDLPVDPGAVQATDQLRDLAIP